jgi:hypothetical protein
VKAVEVNVCTREPIEDMGSGVRVERRYLNGVLGGIAWWHVCCGVEREDYMPMQPAWKDGWVVERVAPLTLSPSILCLVPECKRHGFIRDGKWVEVDA